MTDTREPLSNLAGLVQEVQRWQWIFSNTPELSADKYAREEASRQKESARLQLEKGVQSRVGLKQFGVQTILFLAVKWQVWIVAPLDVVQFVDQKVEDAKRVWLLGSRSCR